MGVIENAKDLADLIKKIGDADLYRRIVELEGEVIELTREKRNLEEQNHELEEKLALVGKMTFKEPFYFQDGDRVPFCPRCWEAERLAVHVQYKWKTDHGERFECPKCKAVVLAGQRF